MSRYLSAMDYTGERQVNDMKDVWFGGDEHNWLSQQPGVTSPGQENDMWFTYLRGQGYTGALSDMLYAYWTAPARLVPMFTSSNYGTLATPIVAEAGDTVEIKFATTAAGIDQHLTDGDDASDRGYIYFSSGNTINWSAAEITALTLDGAAATSGSTAVPNDGKEHTIVPVLAAGAKLSIIGDNYSHSAGFNGQIFSVKYTDISTGDVQDIVFDSGSILYQLARGTALGADVYPAGAADVLGTGWLMNGDSFVATSAAQFTSASKYFEDDLNIGKYYIIKTTVSGLSGTLRIPYSAGDSAFSGTTRSITSNGTYYDLVLCDDVSTDKGIRFDNFSAPALSCTITIEAIQQLPDTAVLFTNFSESDWARYTLQRNYRGVTLGWWGAEKVINGTFNSDVSGWSAFGVGAITFVASGEADVSVLGEGTVYQSSAQIAGIWSVSLDARSVVNDTGTFNISLTSGDSTDYVVDGLNEFLVNVTPTEIRFADGSGIVDNVSAQHLIEVVQ